MPAVKYEDLSLAFEFVSSAAPMENRAYVSLDSGAIHWISEWNADEDDEIPDDLETSDRYVAIPHKNDLDLGRRLVSRFVGERLPGRRDRVTEIFSRRGAYGRFKEWLAAEGRLQEWFAFEADATEPALRQWCRDNDIELVEGGEAPSA